MGRRKQTLGPANDDSEAVQVEIRAAELEQGSGGATSRDERSGWEQHPWPGPVNNPEHQYLSMRGWVASRHAGYLARELATHDDRENRDADAWPWDPSRPVAGQYEIHAQAELEARWSPTSIAMGLRTTRSTMRSMRRTGTTTET